MNTFMNVQSFLFTNIHELFKTVHDHTWTHLKFDMEVIRNHQTIMEKAKFILLWPWKINRDHLSTTLNHEIKTPQATVKTLKDGQTYGLTTK